MLWLYFANFVTENAYKKIGVPKFLSKHTYITTISGVRWGLRIQGPWGDHVWPVLREEWRVQLRCCHARAPDWPETFWQVNTQTLHHHHFSSIFLKFSNLALLHNPLNWTELNCIAPCCLNICRSRPRSEQSLVGWATPQLHDIDALDQMVDPALQGLYPSKSLSRFADAIALCVQVRPPWSVISRSPPHQLLLCSPNAPVFFFFHLLHTSDPACSSTFCRQSEPEFRPPMSEVVQLLVRLVQRANMTRMCGADGHSWRRDGESRDQEPW